MCFTKSTTAGIALGLLAIGFATGMTSGAAAFPIPFSASDCPDGSDCYGFKAGPITEIASGAPDALQAFDPGEDVYVRFDITGEATYSEPESGIGRYLFSEGGFELGGLDSGAVLPITGGLEVVATATRFSLSSIEKALTDGYALDGVEFRFDFEAFGTPDDFASVLADGEPLFREDGWLKFRNHATRDTTVLYARDGEAAPGMVFGAPSRVSAVPAPPALALLLGSLGAAGLLRIRHPR